MLQHAPLIRKFKLAAGMVAIIAASGLTTTSWAEDSPEVIDSPTSSFLKEMNERLAASDAQKAENEESGESEAFYVPYGNLKDVTPEQRAHATETSRAIVDKMLSTYAKEEHVLFSKKSSLNDAMQRVKQRADDIADEVMAAQRDEVLEFLGIDPDGNSNLYYFVSWSMPQSMIRSYALEAMWSGGTLVFKGVPPGQTFGDFMSEGLAELTYGKGVSANISIDPRLFDAYQVEAVPSMVLTTYRTELECVGVNPKSFEYEGQTLSYDTCPPLDENMYSKMTGGVTSNYALQEFLDGGMDEAEPYLKALARGFALGIVPDKSQKPFRGKWENVLSPSEKMAAERALGTLGELGNVGERPISRPE